MDHARVCGEHSGAMQMLQQHDRQIADLYSKIGEIKADLADLKLVMATKSTEIQMGLNETRDAVLRLERLVQEHVKIEEKREIEYRSALSALDERVEEIEDFDWFIRAVNKVRDHAVSVLLGSAVTAVLLWMVYGAHIARMVKG